MIKLSVKNYCDKCPEFEPDILMNKYETIGGDTVILGDCLVICKNREKCAKIENHLKEKLSKETKENGN